MRGWMSPIIFVEKPSVRVSQFGYICFESQLTYNSGCVLPTHWCLTYAHPKGSMHSAATFGSLHTIKAFIHHWSSYVNKTNIRSNRYCISRKMFTNYRLLYGLVEVLCIQDMYSCTLTLDSPYGDMRQTCGLWCSPKGSESVCNLSIMYTLHQLQDVRMESCRCL